MDFRIDFRNNNQIRPLSVELGIVSEADGSCRFSQGQTSVIVSIYGPSTPKYGRLEEFDKASLEVEYNIPCGNSLSGPMETVAASFLKSSIQNCITLTEFPRQVIVVRVTVLRDDGSVLSTALNACSLALVDAGFPMRAIPTSITCVLSSMDYSPKEGDKAESKSALYVLLDPTQKEEHDSVAHFLGTFVSWDKSRLGSMDNTTESRLLAVESSGSFSPEQLMAAMEIGSTAAEIIKTFMRKLVENRSHDKLLG